MPEWVICMQAKLAKAAAAHAEFPHSSGSTNSSSAPELTSVPIGPWSPADGMAAQPWDLDPAEITICKRPDGSDWVLGVGSFGQVCQILVQYCDACMHTQSSNIRRVREWGHAQILGLHKQSSSLAYWFGALCYASAKPMYSIAIRKLSIQAKVEQSVSRVSGSMLVSRVGS